MSKQVNKNVEAPAGLDNTPSSPTDEYVGYAHPPTKSRFQKGHKYYPPKSGSGKGKRLQKAMEAALAELIPVEVEGALEYKSIPEVLITRLVERALHDDKGTRALEILFDLIDRFDVVDESEAVELIDPDTAEQIKKNFAKRVLEQAQEEA
jgi:hypothetical protein